MLHEGEAVELGVTLSSVTLRAATDDNEWIQSDVTFNYSFIVEQ